MKTKVTFSIRVLNSVGKAAKEEIIRATKASPQMIKEIKRVFQQANRRIQNVQQSGYFSPAVQALNKGDISTYSKFSVAEFNKTGNWNGLKQEYTKAVNFLNQPTSTATGAKQWNTQIQAQSGLDDESYKTLMQTFSGYLGTIDSSSMLLQNYDDIKSQFLSEASDVASQIEYDSIALIDKIESQIDKTATSLSKKLDDIFGGGWFDL